MTAKIKKLAKKKGIETVLFDGKLSVAASCLAAAEIMQSLGFKLPKKLSFEPLPEDTSGRCIYPDETVQINSNLFSFRNLEDRLNEALAKFGDEEAHGIVLLKPYKDYYYGYEDDNGKKIYLTYDKDNSEKPDIEEIINEEKKGTNKTRIRKSNFIKRMFGISKK